MPCLRQPCAYFAKPWVHKSLAFIGSTNLFHCHDTWAARAMSQAFPLPAAAAASTACCLPAGPWTACWPLDCLLLLRLPAGPARTTIRSLQALPGHGPSLGPHRHQALLGPMIPRWNMLQLQQARGLPPPPGALGGSSQAAPAPAAPAPAPALYLICTKRSSSTSWAADPARTP
jgi:hypothetical protein